MKEKFEYTEGICLCGSGKPYLECCFQKSTVPDDGGDYKAFMQEFDRLHNKYKKVCMHPQSDNCSIIKAHAHTISQKAVLELIAENGRVLMPIEFGINKEFRMEPVGIEAKATKFYCFCSTHDGFFAPIDKENVELTKYNCFLYAYRIFASTYYKIDRELGCYYKLREKYDLTNRWAALILYKQMEINMKILQEIKNVYDNAILKESYDILENISVNLKYRVYFAAATCFCPTIDLYGNLLGEEGISLPLVYISVIPERTSSKIVFSWLKTDEWRYSFFKEQIKAVPTRLILKYINNLLPLNCENMTVSPMLWKAWTEEARREYISIASPRMRNSEMIYSSKEYFAQRQYDLFLKI